MSRAPEGTELTLVVLQPTSLCNLNCGYCYVPNRRDSSVMPLTVLEAVFQKTIGAPIGRKRRFEFLWHAGEPLTVGLDYFRTVMDLIERYRPPDVRVVQSIQTNGVLIDQDWARFFHKNDFKVGVSIDGPIFLHDAHRKTWGGKGSLDAALRGFHLLQETGLNPAVLAVLTAQSLDYPDEIFEFFLENEVWSFGFNVEEVENVHRLTSFGVTNANPPKRLRERYAAFFSRLFDLWWPVRDFISIREIRDVTYGVRRKFNHPDHYRKPDETAELGIVTVQKNGDIGTYSPEFAGVVDADYNNFVVGNILKIESIEDIRKDAVYKRLYEEIERGRSVCADTCKYFDLCGSAFVSNRYFETGRIDTAESTSCILQRQVVAEVVLGKLQSLSVERKRGPIPAVVPMGMQT